MIKDKLNKLVEKNLDPTVNNTIKRITEMDEIYLYHILSSSGLKLKDDIILKYYNESIGFRCYNERQDIYGKSVLSQNIERFLNRK